MSRPFELFRKGPYGLWAASIGDGKIPCSVSNLWNGRITGATDLADGPGGGEIDWDAARQAEAKLSRLSLYGFLGLLKRPDPHRETGSHVIHLEEESAPPPEKTGNSSQTTG
jgi:hypothetical protein